MDGSSYNWESFGNEGGGFPGRAAARSMRAAPYDAGQQVPHPYDAGQQQPSQPGTLPPRTAQHLYPQYQAVPLVPPQTIQQSHETNHKPQRFRISEHQIQLAETSEIICTISRPDRLSSLLSSSKSAIVINRNGSDAVMGTVKMHGHLSKVVDLSLNGRESVLKAGGSMHDHWTFTSPMAPAGSFWWFEEKKEYKYGSSYGSGYSSGKYSSSKYSSGYSSSYSSKKKSSTAGDKDEGSAEADENDAMGDEDEEKKYDSWGTPLKAFVLKDGKVKGNTIARLKDEVLTIKMPGLSPALVEEILVAAVGMEELMKQKRKDEMKALKLILKVAVGT